MELHSNNGQWAMITEPDSVTFMNRKAWTKQPIETELDTLKQAMIVAHHATVESVYIVTMNMNPLEFMRKPEKEYRLSRFSVDTGSGCICVSSMELSAAEAAQIINGGKCVL